MTGHDGFILGLDVAEELLLLCARARPNAEAVARIRSVAAGVDGQRLASLAREHQMAPVVLARLMDTAPSAVTPELRRAACQRLPQSLALCGLLVEVAARLEGAGIRALSVKGPVLSQVLYGSPAQRPACDLELLVSPSEVWAAADALRAASFEARRHYTPPQRRAYLRTEDEYNLARDDDAMVKLHWELIPGQCSPRLAIERLRQRGESVQIAGRVVRTLCREDHLLLLAAHAAKHLWRPVRLLAEFAGLAGDRLEWRPLLEWAESAHAERVLLTALQAAHELFGARVPKSCSRKRRGTRSSSSWWARLPPPFSGLNVKRRRGFAPTHALSGRRRPASGRRGPGGRPPVRREPIGPGSRCRMRPIHCTTPCVRFGCGWHPTGRDGSRSSGVARSRTLGA
jgi:hypothetical protein